MSFGGRLSAPSVSRLVSSASLVLDAEPDTSGLADFDFDHSSRSLPKASSAPLFLFAVGVLGGAPGNAGFTTERPTPATDGRLSFGMSLMTRSSIRRNRLSSMAM